MRCRLQYLKDSIDGIVNFFESSTAVSQTIALETAAAVQVCNICHGVKSCKNDCILGLYALVMVISLVTVDLRNGKMGSSKYAISVCCQYFCWNFPICRA